MMSLGSSCMRSNFTTEITSSTKASYSRIFTVPDCQNRPIAFKVTFDFMVTLQWPLSEVTVRNEKVFISLF